MNTWIDFDSPIYAMASACDGSQWNYKGRSWDLKSVAVKAIEAEGKDPSLLYQTKTPEEWENVERTIVKYCNDVMNNLADPFNTTLLIGGGGNFRFDIATIEPYKGNRVSEKPYHFDAIKNFVEEVYGAKRVYGIEVDDAVGILAEPGDLIISQDKDLLQLPGLHKHPVSGFEQEVTWIQGLRSFYAQVLVGDSSDSIPGLHGVGKSSSYVKAISKAESEGEMFNLVSKLYMQRFGSYWKLFLLENCRLLWLLRSRTSEPPLWMRVLMDDLSFYTETKWEDFLFVKPANC